MKKFITLLSLLPLIVISQNKSKSAVEDLIVKKWTSGIVNLDVRSNYATSTLMQQNTEAYRKGTMSNKDYEKTLERAFYDLYEAQHTFSGTAIFALIRKRHYLLTAKHVIEDIDHKETGNVFAKIFLIENGSSADSTGVVPDDRTNPPGHLITSSSTDVKAFAFSKISDLAVIDLEHWARGYGTNFLQILNSKGYKAIELSDIDAVGNVKENTTIYAFGFPSESEIAYVRLKENTFFWRSRAYTIPFISTGQSKEIPGNSDLFDGGIFVYHGFSGGPVVIDGKLAGVVSGAAFKRRSTTNQSLPTSILLENHFVKAKLLLPLIEELETKFP